jgi:DNA-binding XRE family transcriptional regulator
MPSSFDDFVARAEQERGTAFSDRVAESQHQFALSWQIRERRLAMGLTQTALAERCGVPQSEISRIESGASNPTLATINAIAGSLGVRMELAES